MVPCIHTHTTLPHQEASQGEDVPFPNSYWHDGGNQDNHTSAGGQELSVVHELLPSFQQE